MIHLLKLEVFEPLPRSKIQLRGNAPWVAEIIGIKTYRSRQFVRRFMQYDTDYTEANGVGSRGVYRYYHLRPGPIYEICRRLSWQRQERFFAIVTNTGLSRISYEAVLEELGHGR